MTDALILKPVIALMGWTMVMWVWMYVTRIPAMSKAGIAPDDAAVTSTLDAALPAQVQSKAQNYNHLHEQPTVFYAVCLTLALIDPGNGTMALLAWIYTGLRVAHSLVQVTANKVTVRFILFAISSVVLIALIVNAGLLVF